MNDKKNDVNHNSRYLLGFLFLTVFIVFQSTYSKIPVSDAPTWIRALSNLDWYYIFIPTHSLPLFGVLTVKTALAIFKILLDALTLIQVINSFLSCVISFLLYRLTRVLKISFFAAFTSTTIFSFSYGLWYFSNGELHHLGILFVLVIFLRLVAYRAKPTSRIAFQIGILHGAAILLHQEHGLYAITIIFMMTFNLRSNEFVRKNVLIYLGSAALISIPTVIGLSAFVNHSLSITDTFKWFFYIHQKGFSEEGYVLLRWHDWSFLRCIKGSAMAICYGSQIVVDFLRYAEIRHIGYVRTFFAFSIFFFIVFMGTCLLGINRFKHSGLEIRSIIFGLILWVVSYKFLFNLTYMPESPEYHISSNIPLFIFFAIALQSLNSTPLRIGLFISLFIAMITVNLFGSIMPWKQHGYIASRFGTFASTTFRDTDFFISTESCLDAIVDTKWRRLSLKNLLLTHSAADVLKKVGRKIDEELEAGHSVYIYNFIPSDYALRSVNFYHRGALVSKDIFRREWSRMRSIYEMEPIYQYWEETDSRHYLFDPERDTVWKIKPSK